MSKSKLKFACVLILTIAMCFGIFAGCGSRKLSDDFDETEVKTAAEDVIALIDGNDSDGLKEMCNEALQEALTDEVLDSVYEAIGKGGAFKEVETISVASVTQDDQDFAVAVAKVNYETQSFTYTLTFTKDMMLAGLYYK